MMRLLPLLLHRREGLKQTLAVLSRWERLSWDEGISAELQGFTEYNGSISAFVKPADTKLKTLEEGDSPLPCGEEGPKICTTKTQYMASITGQEKLPSPRNLQKAAFKPSPSPSPSPPTPPPLSLAQQEQQQSKRLVSDVTSPSLSSLPRKLPTPRGGSATVAGAEAVPQGGVTAATASDTTVKPEYLHAREAEDYYRAVPRNALSKEEMWKRITLATADKAEHLSSALQASEADYLRMEEELKEQDLFHYRMGEIAYPDRKMRRNYYAMWQLAMSLNKARWTMLDVHSQRGVKTTGAGMKLLFWKESINQIMEKRQMTAGQFTDSHPVLRPFAAAVEQNPTMTKAFVRGFTEARLRVVQQPGNVKQLFDHFDRYYGYFFNSLLDISHVKDENAEHMMQHIGRAIGLTQHCVMFWKKYARIGFTMLPADLCADNHVNLALLRNISLASRDRAVRKLLYDVMCIVKTEMLHAEQLAPHVSPTAWPIVMECSYANYYLGFLQRRDFNVSAMFADHNIENAGFAWYRVKKRWEWERHQSIKYLVSEEAPLPLLGTLFGHRSSKYKMSSGIGRSQ